MENSFPNKREQFSESIGQGKLSFEEQIMSKDKFPSKFPCQKVAIYCVNPSNIFPNTRSFEN